MRTFGRSLTAGAVGTLVLDVVTYLDMALTGRGASSAPADTVLAAADRGGISLSTDGSRPEAYGALAGIGVGVGIGGVAGLVRAAGLRLPLLAEAAVIGAAAMAATDGPMALTEVSDPSTWSTTDWTRDVLPHLAYGAAVAAVLRGLEPGPTLVRSAPDPSLDPAISAAALEAEDDRTPKVVRRSLALGLAAGARSTLGLAPLLARGPRSGALATALVLGEGVVDKLPGTPSRLEPGPAAGRLGAGALGGAAVAHGEDASLLLGVVAGAVGAAAGSVLGAVWREMAAERGWTWQAALAEDATALGLAAYAWRS